MSGHDHHHDHDHSELSETQLRVRALETVLTEKGYVDPAALDLLIETYEKKVGPRNGARVVAKAWADPAYRARLFKDATPAIAELGYAGRQGEHIVALENTPKLHNMVVCTLCSCYPWPVLGLPPVWYKSAPYRSRAVADPRGVLADFGVTLPKDTEIRVWDSTAEIRYLVDADAARRHRRLERGQTRRPGDARFDDRHRPAEVAEGRRNERRAGSRRHARSRPGRAGAERAGVSRRMGKARASRSRLPRSAAGRLEHRHVALCAREPPARRISVDELLPDLVRRAGGDAEGTRPDGGRRDRGRPLVASAETGPAHAVAGDVAQVLCIAAGRPSARPTPRHASRPATKCAPRTSIPSTHTRLPRYVRGHTGIIERVIGCHVFPDSNALGTGENPQWLYTVRFDGRELWGADAIRP